MNGITKQRSIGFGFNEGDLKTFLRSDEAKKLGINLKKERKYIAGQNDAGKVRATVYSIMQGDDILVINNGHGSSRPLEETGRNSLKRLAEKLTLAEKLKDAIVLPSKQDAAIRVSHRPLIEQAREFSEKIMKAIGKKSKL